MWVLPNITKAAEHQLSRLFPVFKGGQLLITTKYLDDFQNLS
jgi:hypothetical protein